MTDTR